MSALTSDVRQRSDHYKSTETMEWLTTIIRLALLALLGEPLSRPLFPFDELMGAIVRLTNGGRPIDMTNLRPNPIEYIVWMCGYRLETHQIVTDDGYILTLHRIPANNDDDSMTTSVSKRPPMLMLHGFIVDALSYVVKGNNSAPAFIFNDAGYDVWLINFRGTRYSREHVSFDPDNDKEYWDHSFHEMGLYDVPAAIKYVLSTTNADRLYLVGYSMGGSSAMIFLSANPEYASKIKAMFLWSPAIQIGRSRFPPATRFRWIINIYLDLMNDMEMLAFSLNTLIFARQQCISYVGFRLCDYLISLLIGIEFPWKQETFFETLALTTPGNSVKVARHFLQMIDRNDFSQFDYGSRNFEIYHQENPPPYDLSKVPEQIPTWIMLSNGDNVVNSTDVLEVAQRFPNANLITIQRPPGWPGFSHLDYVYGEDIRLMVCDPMLREMSRLEAEDGTYL